MSIRQISFCLLAFCWVGQTNRSNADEPAATYAALPAELDSVPQNLLKLAHADEVQQELGLDDSQMIKWENMLRKLDSTWWPARILKPTEQRKIIADLESKLISQTELIAGSEAVTRLRQIELQSQGVRILLRPEISKLLRLENKQREKISELFAANDRLTTAVASAKTTTDPEKLRTTAEAVAAEPKKVLALLTAPQTDRLRKVLGDTIETAKLKRIYPLAPELIDSKYWTSADKATLSELRGQVVLVHFYAFQCHNCVANFKHYKRWEESLKSRGVRLVGIQTPETSAERDPVNVTAAAKKEGFLFPVLIDVDKKNWDAWGNTMWPTVYVIDKKGYIRFWWQGELNWEGAKTDQQIEAIIDQLVAE